MKRTSLTVLVMCLMVLLALPGCDGTEADASVSGEETQRIETPAAPNTAQPNASARFAAEQPADPSAYIVIQNAKPADPQQLIRQLQQVLPQTQVVKLAQSPNPREIKLEVTNVKDVRALANKIPFASVESIDLPTRTITVDFDL